MAEPCLALRQSGGPGAGNRCGVPGRDSDGMALQLRHVLGRIAFQPPLELLDSRLFGAVLPAASTHLPQTA